MRRERDVGVDSLRSLELGSSVLAETKEYSLHGGILLVISRRSPKSRTSDAGHQVVREGESRGAAEWESSGVET